MNSKYRLPIQHPDYRYPESRNPYSGKINEIAGRAFNDNQTEEHKDHWREQFPDYRTTTMPPGTRRALHVEIGCSGGHVILEHAARNPENAFIGIDWKFKQIHRGAEKAAKRGINNLLFFRAHAERIGYMFGTGEIDHLALYFPDPWAKKSQLKNRLITQDNLRMLSRLVQPGGQFHIKTDHVEYFAWMEEAFGQVKDLWEVTSRTNDLHASHPNPESLDFPDVTLFEQLFIQQKIKINELKAKRTFNSAPL